MKVGRAKADATVMLVARVLGGWNFAAIIGSDGRAYWAAAAFFTRRISNNFGHFFPVTNSRSPLAS